MRPWEPWLAHRTRSSGFLHALPLSPYDQAGRAGPGFVGEPRSAPCVPGLGRPVWLVLLPHAGSQCVRAAVRQVSVFGSPTWRFPHVGVDFRGVVLPAPRPSRRAVQNVLCELRVPGVRAGAGSTSLTQHRHTPEGGVATRWLHGLELETSQSWRSEVTRSGSVSTGSEQRSTSGDRQLDFTERPLPFRLLGPLTLHLVWRDLARWVVRNPETRPARSNRCLSRRAKTSCQSRSILPSAHPDQPGLHFPSPLAARLSRLISGCGVQAGKMGGFCRLGLKPHTCTALSFRCP